MTLNPFALAADLIEQQIEASDIEADWRAWNRAVFPNGTRHGYGSHHVRFWEWVDRLRAGEAAPPHAAVWARGGAKSSMGEQAIAKMAAKRTRRYVVVVSDTQDQANDKVANVQGLLESPSYAARYPEASQRLVGKYQHSKGWKRGRLRTADKFTVDALGLDSAFRGAKIDEDRPDIIILDDVDDVQDTRGTTERKFTEITRSILPALAPHGTVLFLQNLILAEGIAAKILNGELLQSAEINGPIPSLFDMTYEMREGKALLTGGRPSWEGQSLAACQQLIDLYGLTAFLSENQHDLRPPAGGMFDHLDWEALHVNPQDVPPLDRIVIWVDPAVTDKDSSDSHGCQVDGIARDGTIYRLRSWEKRASPEQALRKAILYALEFGVRHIGIETDQGGDTWGPAFRAVLRDMEDNDELRNPDGTPAQAQDFSAGQAKAGQTQMSKAARAQLMLPDYETGKIRHVLGTHTILENALTRFPKHKPYDLVDAAGWAHRDLRSGAGTSIASPLAVQLPRVLPPRGRFR